MSRVMRQGRFDSRLRFRFRHASADRRATENVIVELRDADGLCGYGEGCPRSYVTGETEASAAEFLGTYGAAIADVAATIAGLQAWSEAHATLIDANPAAFSAIELAALDLIGRRDGRPLEDLVGARRLAAPVAYSAVIGNCAPVATFLLGATYRLYGFADYKIKLSGDTVRDRRRLAMLPRGIRLRADANNLWPDADTAIAGLRALDAPFNAIEEPVAAGDVAAMRAVGEALDTRIVLDESLTRSDQLDRFADDPQRWIANIRVSKCGGVLRACRLARLAQVLGLDIVLGAHVGETSLLTRAALAVGQALDRPALAREGAYGEILLARDLTVPALRFARGGQLDPARHGLADAPGLGLVVAVDRVDWSA